MPQRLRAERNQSRGQRAGHAAHMHEPVEPDNQAEIGGDNRQAERAVDDRATEDQLDIEQPVAEDRDRNGDRDRRNGDHDRHRRDTSQLPGDELLGQARDQCRRHKQCGVGQPEHLQTLHTTRAAEANHDRPCRCDQASVRTDPERREQQPDHRGKRGERTVDRSEVAAEVLRLERDRDHQTGERDQRGDRDLAPTARQQPPVRKEEGKRGHPGEHRRPIDLVPQHRPPRCRQRARIGHECVTRVRLG